MRRNLFAVAFVVLVAVPITAGAAGSPSLAAFYQDKQMRFIIASKPGGSYDIWARMISRHMGSYLPGHPSFVAQNMPGGGQIKAANYLYNIAPKDGTVIGTFSRNLPTKWLLKDKNIRFKPNKFNWIGSPELTNRVCVARAGAKVQKAEDLFTKTLLVGGAGAGTAVSTTPNLLRALLGMKFKLVEGYGGATDVVLAIERGEVEGICQTYSALKSGHAKLMQSGKLKVLFNLERQPIPGIGAPSVFKFVKTEQQRRILAFYSSNTELGRPTAAPPGLPHERVQALRRAFDATMKDKAFAREAAKQRLEIAPLTGEELAQRVADLVATPEETVKLTQSMLAKLNPVITETVTISAVHGKGKTISFDGKTGKMTVKVSGKKTRITIAGKKAKRSAIKAGMTCEVRHQGFNSNAKKIVCR